MDWRELAYDAVVDRSPVAVRQVAKSYREVLARAGLAPTDSQGEWIWRDARLGLVTPRDRITRATIDLVTDPELRLLHRCEDDACGLVYLDTSPRHNRRWCKASDCGNRNRARRITSEVMRAGAAEHLSAAQCDARGCQPGAGSWRGAFRRMRSSPGSWNEQR